MRIRKKYLLLKLALYIIILLWMHCLYLFKYPSLMSKIAGQEAYRYFLGYLSVFIFIGINILYKNKLRNFNNLIPLLWVYFFTYIFQAFYTMIAYSQQSLTSTLHVGAPFLITLLVPLVLVVCTDKKNFENLLVYVDVITFLWSVMLIVQSIYFQNGGSFAFDFQNYFTTGVTFRDDNIRLSLGSIANMMIVYRIYKVFYKNSRGYIKIYNYISLVTSIYALIVIQQTRMYTAVIGIVFVVLLLCNGKSNGKKILAGVATIGAVYLLVSENVISDFLASFSVNSEKGVSTITRIYEVKYYISCFFSNPLFGNGLTSEMIYPNIEHGTLGTLYYVDVGIVGLFAQVGLCAVVFYVIPFFRMVKTTILSVRYNKDWQIDVALIVYMFATSWTLLQIHPVQVMGYVLSFSYFEYRRYEISERCRRENSE